MSNSIPHNSASRLFELLTKASRIKPELPTINAWASIFDCPPTDKIQLYLLLSKAMQLPRETEQLVKIHFPSQITQIPHWKEPIETAFTQHSLDQSWMSFRRYISEQCIAHVSTLSELLHTKIKSYIISDTDLENIRTQFTEIHTDILSSDISQELKSYLSREILKLLNLLAEYRITGLEPALQQVDALFGYSLRDEEYSEFLKKDETGKKMVNCLSTVSNIITVLTGLPQLTVAANFFLK